MGTNSYPKAQHFAALAPRPPGEGTDRCPRRPDERRRRGVRVARVNKAWQYRQWIGRGGEALN